MIDFNLTFFLFFSIFLDFRLWPLIHDWEKKYRLGKMFPTPVPQFDATQKLLYLTKIWKIKLLNYIWNIKVILLYNKTITLAWRNSWRALPNQGYQMPSCFAGNYLESCFRHDTCDICLWTRQQSQQGCPLRGWVMNALHTLRPPKWKLAFFNIYYRNSFRCELRWHHQQQPLSWRPASSPSDLSLRRL